MYQKIHITIRQESSQRRILNALLALSTGALALIWPNFIYYIVGGYLVALGLILYYFRVSNFLTALSLLTALLIFLLPELIPYTFAFFLGVFGLTFILAIKLIPLGVISLIFAGLIIAYPGSVAYMIGAFLILYGVTHFIQLFQEIRNMRQLQG